jgi:hypothetical protein
MAGNQERVFSPIYGTGILKTSISNTVITDTINVKKANQVVVTNLGTVPCYVRFSKDGSVASSADYLIPPNCTSIALSIDPDTDKISYLSSSATAVSVHTIFGNGM